MAPRRTLVVDGSVVEGAASLEEASLVAWRVASAAARHEADEVVVLRAAGRHPRRPRRRRLARASPPRADRARRSSRVSSSSSRRHRISAARSYRATRTSPWSARSRDTTPPRPRRACAPCPTTSKSTIGVATARAWWFPKKIQSGPEHPPSRTSVSAPPSRSIARSRSGSESPSSSRTNPRRLAKKSPPPEAVSPRSRADGYWGFDVRLANAAEDHPAGETREDEGVRVTASSRRHDDRGRARERERAARALSRRRRERYGASCRQTHDRPPIYTPRRERRRSPIAR